MAPAFDPEALPDHARRCVEEALRDVDRSEAALEVLDLLLSHRREPNALIARALVEYQETALRMVHRRAEAATHALALIEEALDRGAALTDGLERFQRLCETTLADERRRERRLLARATGRRARPADLALLAHRLLLEGTGDRLAFSLLATAGDAAAEEAELTRAAS